MDAIVFIGQYPNCQPGLQFGDRHQISLDPSSLWVAQALASSTERGSPVIASRKSRGVMMP